MSTDQPQPGQPAPQPSQPSHRALRRVGGGLLALLIGLGAVVLLVIWFNSRDDAGVDHSGDASANVPGQVFDQPQQYLDARQVALLDKGDVFVVSAGARPAAPLVALREQLSGPPDPVLEQAGQAVVLVQRPGTDGVVALAHGRRLETADPADPRLETFAAHWLGRGAGG
jgi:hypothetical protein